METEKSKVIKIENAKQYNRLRNRGLVIVDFNTKWCGPCKKFAPTFEKLANNYPDTVFISIDPEEVEHDDCENIRSVPTFKVFVNGDKRREFTGVDEERLIRYIERYQIQIVLNGKCKSTFTKEDRERIITYIDSNMEES